MQWCSWWHYHHPATENMLLQCMCQKINVHKMTHISQICQSLHVQMWDSYVSIYVSYKCTAYQNVTRITGIHTLHIISICLWTNMQATLYICVLMHCYSSLHIDHTLFIKKPVGFSSSVICICTTHLATIFILSHLWPFMYFLFGIHISFSLIMKKKLLKSNIHVHPYKMLVCTNVFSDSHKYFTL